MPGLEGRTLGHHHLKQLLGRGGMAEVYLARDEHLFRDVAIKVVHTSRLDHVARFRREGETMGPLAHDHILPVFEYGQQDGWHYLIDALYGSWDPGRSAQTKGSAFAAGSRHAAGTDRQCLTIRA